MGETDASPKSSDRDLVSALARRDPTAMRHLYDRYSERIFGFLYRMTRDRAVSDDLHQETWLAVARNVTTLRLDSDLTAWLFTIARNKHRSWYRWRMRIGRLQSDAEGLLQGVGGHREKLTKPDDLGGGSPGNLRDLERALARLSPILREVLLLVGCEGLDAGQAAAICGVTPEAVRQRVWRARRALRAVLASMDEMNEMGDAPRPHEITRTKGSR